MSAIPEFSHERVLTSMGARSGLVITVALHSSALGPALGGCRMWSYPTWADGQADALRLSAAMTLKNAAAGLDAGGGKSVIALPMGEALDPDRRRAALLDLGDLVEALEGRYRTAEDVGTTEHDMLVVRERTEHVVGLPAESGGAGEPAGATALGVFSAIAPTLGEAFGSEQIEGRSFVISGLGQVGGRLARMLAGHGAELIVTDIDERKRELADELGARWIAPEMALSTPADVLVPAGLGGILTDEAIDALPVRAVVGPANNPLADRSGAERLQERGIVYAPDFVVNAGGVIHLEGMAHGQEWPAIAERLTGIADTVRGVMASARERGTTPLAAAEALAAARIEAARGSRAATARTAVAV
ncbi:Glu/Leu/Phe/Val dehydrogenase dimerization domain-containing protein [Agrococcus sp. TF02-05]|uniref:Glu/Leu/Phe/Val dehydrogenase dimerization domain-containing protein n=1 Tax=Agrococcus sp. TF02-05 TaxID=2815211 RepID=UPI001AA0B24E|nr:Glu/Leu/Phe/Val dehydrogenase dimerization domain-containing protein [Agrococcus sp. TF02-05]MBO1770846.1 Glu/Leu/Phe/Val dehydrogenase family protein [Agrococcus sp. TF02-05]